MKKEKLILAAVSFAMIAGSILGLSLLIGHIQGQTVIENIVTEEKEPEEEGIVEKPFQVFVSGQDLTDQKDIGRSDLNLVLTVNPVSKKILITSIPRDSYVDAPDMPLEEHVERWKASAIPEDEVKELEKAAKDCPVKTKLCLLNYYGTPELVKAVEGLLDTKIDYHVQITLSGFRRLVDAVGGIDVEAAQSFRTDWGTSYKKGVNRVNGKEALAYVRERHCFQDGVFGREKNGIDMMSAIVRKLCDASVLDMDADALYQLWKSNVKTNMSAGEVLSLLRMQVKDRAEWEVSSVAVGGEGALKRMIDYPTHKLYVTVADQDSLEKAKEKMAQVSGKEQAAN